MIDPLIVMRTVHIAATLLASGTVMFQVVVAEPVFAAAQGGAAKGAAALRRRWVLMVWIALAAAILSGAGWLALLAADLYGAPVIAVCLHGGVWTILTETRFGLVWSSRLALAIVLGLLMLAPLASFASLRECTQILTATAFVTLLAFVAHAGATPGGGGQIHLISDIVHLLAAGAWVGSLPALAMLMAQSIGSRHAVWSKIVARAASRFSVLGIACVAALLASGLINSWNLLGGVRDLVATDYGRLVLLKIALFAAMVGIAAVNRFRLTPRLAAVGARRELTRNSLAETGLGLIAIVFVGALGTMEPTSHVHMAPANIPPGAAFVHIHAEPVMADVTIAPGRTGPVQINIRLSREDFTIFPAEGLKVVLTQQAQPNAAPLSRTATRLPDGTWQLNGLDIVQSGIWTVKLTVTSGTGAPYILDGPIVIER